MKKRKSDFKFTLIELLAVIAIIAILALCFCRRAQSNALPTCCNYQGYIPYHFKSGAFTFPAILPGILLAS
jgi:prepilin-type N-terminal cleavage/methylation domain-containing protein